MYRVEFQKFIMNHQDRIEQTTEAEHIKELLRQWQHNGAKSMSEEGYIKGKSSRMFPILLVLNEYGPLTTAEIAENIGTKPKHIWNRLEIYWHRYHIVRPVETVRSGKPGRPALKYEITKQGKNFLKKMIKIKTQYPEKWSKPNYKNWSNPSYSEWIKQKGYV